jgi:predicted regulator of Ras-like GTPase activity (Roadblock/LC7/MglB family)
MGIKPAVPTAVTPIAPAAPGQAAPIMPKAPAVGDVVPIPLSDISEGWPDPVRQEIARGEWDLAMVMFPINRLDAGMKAGRLNFTWGEIRQWLNPPIGSIHSQHVDVPVELPLKVVAPLFLSARRPTSQKKFDVDETIPDVFGGLKPGAAQVKLTVAPGPVAEENTDIFTAPVAEPTPVAPVEPAPVPMPPPPVSHAPRPDALGAIFGQPLKSDWSPAEIVQKVSEMSGVAGGVITTADGLLVAGTVPESQNVETLAAFLPQIFARLNQYAGEMQIGMLTSLNMATVEAPCAIYKSGKLYLGVIGRAGQTLPDAHLQRIASEIARRNP